MFLYVIRRILWSVPVLLVAVLLTFGLMKQMPGGPFDNNQQVRVNPQVKQNLERKYGLDRPWYIQYVRYVAGISHGDFGPSLKYRDQPVSGLVRDTLPTSMLLGLCAFVFSFTVGVPIGVIAALRANTWTDYTLTLISTAFFAVPVFVIATYWVAYLPAYFGWETWWERLGPITVLGLGIMPYFTRLVRASMLETLQSDFVTTARSKGLPYRRTVFVHMLRNSLIPTVTNAGPLFGFVLTGSFIIELIMDVPGVASEFVRSIQGDPRDLNMVLGTTVLLAGIIIFMNLVVDIIVSYLDPRIAHD